MLLISDEDNEIFEMAVYLPLLIALLEQDRLIFENLPIKMTNPYVNLIEETLKAVRTKHQSVKEYMRKNEMKVQELKKDDNFTLYLFTYKRSEERHNYWNIRLRNRTQELLEHYLYKRFSEPLVWKNN